MAEIHRFSSRRQRLDHSFLVNRLKGAKSYKRIAGYFRSSIFELIAPHALYKSPKNLISGRLSAPWVTRYCQTMT